MSLLYFALYLPKVHFCLFYCVFNFSIFDVWHEYIMEYNCSLHLKYSNTTSLYWSYYIHIIMTACGQTLLPKLSFVHVSNNIYSNIYLYVLYVLMYFWLFMRSLCIYYQNILSQIYYITFEYGECAVEMQCIRGTRRPSTVQSYI